MAKTVKLSFSYIEFDNVDELSSEDKMLVTLAKQAAEKAYAPYSKFRVGAAIRLESGRTVTGANVENAAFPSGICAERNALSNAVVNHSGDVPVAMAIVALAEEGMTGDPVPPCGNCRQVIAEEEFRNGKKIRVILSGKMKIRMIESIGYLLPMQFNKDNLNLP